MSINPENLTPAMRQYVEIKQRYPDALLMFRMGDFYEMFFDDAVKASKELEIVLTSRGQGDKKAPLAGIPFHALEPYLAKLVKKGYKVAICEQLEDAKKAKGIVKRCVVRIVTPGTLIEDSMLEQKDNNYILSLYQHGEEYALALCDISTGEMLAFKCPEQELFNEIAKFNPSECVLPASLAVNQKVIKQLEKRGIFITKYEDWHFASEKAEIMLKEHFNVQSIDGFGISGDIRLNACGALVRYLKETHLQGMKHISSIRKLDRGKHMTLDAASVRNLELMQNMMDGSSRGTLLDVLDTTMTPMGSRMLKQWIKSPLLDKCEIMGRLKAVEIFFQSSMLRQDMQSLMKNFADIERIMGRINCGTATPKDLLALKGSLAKLPKMKDALIPTVKKLLEEKKSNMLVEAYLFKDVSAIVNLISDSIREDASQSIREGNVINPGYNEELNSLYQAKSSGKEYIRNLEKAEKEKTGIKALKIGFNKVFGYYIEISKKNIHLTPKNYIRKQTTANAERYITEELKRQEELILNAEEKGKELEAEIFKEIMSRITEKTEDIQDCANKTAILDMLQCFATKASENNYVMPEINNSDRLEISESRHPVLERLEKNFVPNDIMLGANEMAIITGPNMAGKSTVMRQAALITLMAQCGSFVPAANASIGIVDKIFTRVGAHDDLSRGQSTFMVEMLEVANILNNATEKSLVILDEIGRGTSTFDGVSIAWAVAEHIYGKIRSKTMFATHYHILNKLEEQLPGVKNYNIAVKDEDGEIVFLRNLISGGTDKSYGIHVARLAGVPKETLARAAEIQKSLEDEDEMLRKLNARLHVEQKTLSELSGEKKDDKAS